MKKEWDEELGNSPSPPPDQGRSLRPATAHYSHSHPPPKGPSLDLKGHKTPGVGRMRTVPPASLAAATTAPSTPHSTPPSPRTAPGPARPQARAGPRNPAPAGTASRATDAGITWVLAFSPAFRVDLERRRPRNVPSNLGAAGVLRTCFSLSSPPSWFWRQAAPAELSSTSIEATRS